MNTKLKYIVGMILGALFTIPLASSALSVFTVPQGGTASSSLTGILKGNGKNAIQTATPGTDYVVPSALSSYLSLSSWYATTTDGLDEGLTNLYFTNPRVLTYLDTLSKGYFFSTTSSNYWYTLQNKASSTLLVDNNTWIGGNTFTRVLTAPYFSATSTTATSTFRGALEIGANSRDNGIAFTSGRVYPVSTSVGGAWNLTNTSNTGAGFIIYSNAGASTGRLMNIRADNDAFNQPALHIDYDGIGNAVEVSASSTQDDAVPMTITNRNWTASTIGTWSDVENHGVIKSIHAFPSIGAGSSGNDSVASHISLDSQGIGTAVQGIFMTATTNGGGTTGKLLNLRNRTAYSNAEDEYLTLTYNGKLGLLDGSPSARLDVVGTSTDDYAYFSTTGSANGNVFTIKNSGNVGIGTTSPYAKLSVQGTAGLTDAFAVASSTLATMFNVTANGRVGIGSSTPWGTLSIIDSISGSFFPGVITATSTTDLPYFGWTASTSEYAGSAVRILAGNPSAYMSSADSLDQFLLNGRINTGDWKQMECAHDFNSHTAQIITDITSSVMSVTTGKPCGDFSYIEDANGVADQVVTTGSGYIRLRPGATGATVVAGDGFGLAGTTAFLRHATNTPVYLATVRPGAVQNASTSIYMLGFSAATGVSANYATDAQDGCFFVASSTKANWQAVCRSTTATIVDTGVASSTVTTGDSAWRQFRIDMIGGPTPYAVFRIKQSATASWGPPVATIATTMPTAVSLNPITSVGKVSAGLSPELHINRIRVWYNDPLWY